MAQIAADALELPIETVHVFHGSTNLLQLGFGTYGSRSIVMGGSAVWVAASELKKSILAAAAVRIGCATADIRLVDGRPVTADGRSLAMSDFAGLSAASYASRRRTYSYGAHAAHVTVDSKTGDVRVIDYVAVEDVGRIVNPAGLHGQTIGAIVQGLGGSLLEHSSMMTPASCSLHHSPIICCRPFAIFPVFAPTPCRSTRRRTSPGVKGGGEGGIIPVGGVISNAVASALQSLGVQPRELPLSPPRVWKLMNAGAIERQSAIEGIDDKE